jgi:hypothetical protein
MAEFTYLDGIIDGIAYTVLLLAFIITCVLHGVGYGVKQALGVLGLGCILLISVGAFNYFIGV